MIKRILIFLILTHCICIGSIVGQEEKLQLQLQVNNSETGFLEPLSYSLILRNTGLQSEQIRKPWDLFIPELQLYNTKTGQWEKLNRSDLSDFLKYDFIAKEVYPASQVFTLDSQSFVNRAFTYLFIQGSEISKQYILKEKEKIRLRAVYFPALGDKTRTVVSNEVEVIIKSYQGEDQNAVTWLLKQPIPHFLFEQPLMEAYWGIYTFEHNFAVSEKTIEFINLFPQSKFIGWAQLNLVKYYVVQARLFPDGAISNLRQAEEVFQQALSKMKLPSRLFQTNMESVYEELIQQKLSNNMYSSIDQYWEELSRIDAMFDR
ncbi:MAG: hypothetical protein R2828_29000 [Saprospiraceae bacterium]